MTEQLEHPDGRRRCVWPGNSDALYVAYHDTFWGVPVRGSSALFAKLTLDGFQAGLSWITILRKQPAFEAAFDDFDPRIVAAYTEADVTRLLADAGIVRHRGKIEATINNAQLVVAMEDAGESFSELLWSFVGGEPLINAFGSLSEIPASTDASKAMSKALKKRGFRFVGPTICYALMQAVGMVNDHVVDCYRYAQLRDAG